ncbi:MAG: hypothetical protein ACUVWX_14690, partial [Kiritimatiellia bacterium]
VGEDLLLGASEITPSACSLLPDTIIETIIYTPDILPWGMGSSHAPSLARYLTQTVSFCACHTRRHFLL